MTTTYSEARRQLKSLLDRACEDHVPVRITRRNGKAAVLISEEDLSSLEETAYLLRSPANARRLLDAVESARRLEPGVPIEEAIRNLGLDGDRP